MWIVHHNFLSKTQLFCWRLEYKTLILLTFNIYATLDFLSKTKLFPHFLKSLFNMSLLFYSVDWHSLLTGFFTSNHPQMFLEHYRNLEDLEDKVGTHTHCQEHCATWTQQASINTATTISSRTFVQFSEKDTFWAHWRKASLWFNKILHIIEHIWNENYVWA